MTNTVLYCQDQDRESETLALSIKTKLLDGHNMWWIWT